MLIIEKEEYVKLMEDNFEVSLTKHYVVSKPTNFILQIHNSYFTAVI